MQKVVIAGGGTGGHIYPGIAIAHALQKRFTNVQVEFVGAHGGLEERLVPRENFPLHLVRVGKLHASVGRWTQLKTLLSLPIAMAHCWRLFSQIRPIAVLGVGGYASGPFLLVAAVRGVRTAIWEPNVYPGMTNRLLARLVQKCIVVFAAAAQFLPRAKVVRMGLPIRAQIERLATLKYAETSTDHETQARGARPLKVLVFGGSQGARGINRALMGAFVEDSSWCAGIEILHQTGRLDFAEVQAHYQRGSIRQVEAREFLYDMDHWLQWADLVICRAGASTVAELAAAGKAAILIPLPTAADDHQLKNAQALQEAQAGKVILQSEWTGARVRQEILYYAEHRDELELWSKNVRQFYVAEAADKIAQELVGDLL